MNGWIARGDGTLYSFDGAERDLTIDVDRGIRWKDSIGGPPLPMVYGGGSAANDLVTLKFTAWVPLSVGQEWEANFPPYVIGTPSNPVIDLYLPGSPTTPAIPGFGTYLATGPQAGSWRLKYLTVVKCVRTLGAKGPNINLYGYSLQVQFQAQGHGAFSNIQNPNPGPDTGYTTIYGSSIPTAVIGKFASHQIQDWSSSREPLPGTNTYAYVQHGRRFDANIALDHVTANDMAAIIGWYEAVRNNTTPIQAQNAFGPQWGNSFHAAYLTNLTVNRGAGWWWDGMLSISLVTV